MTMKKLLLSVAFAGLVTAGPAGAADIPIYKAAPPVTVAPFNWSRCYVGAHVGYGWGRNTNDFGKAVASGVTEEGSFFPAEFGPFDHNTRGPVLGGQIGCNYQFAPNWLVGVEGEFWWSGMKGSFTAPEDSPDPGQFSRFESRNLWDADIAVRFGHVIGPNLFYGKVGVAFAKFTYDETHDDFGPALFHGCLPQCTVSLSKTVPGLLLGIGWEHALTLPPGNHWTIKVEYNYINFASHNLAYPSLGAAIQNFPVHDTKQIIKVGVNFYLP